MHCDLEPDSWTVPELDDWVAALNRAVDIAGAFLVAPPNFKRDGFLSPSFSQVPESPLPYPALVIASTNDPYCLIEVATKLAKGWNAGFVSVGPRGHIATEPGNGDWEEAGIYSKHFQQDSTSSCDLRCEAPKP